MFDSTYTFIFLIIIVAPILIFLAIFLPIVLIDNKYKKFVYVHSVSYKELESINKKFNFRHIANFDTSHSYDNENMYGDITCKDYLIYQLVYMQKDIKNAVSNISYNQEMFSLYEKEIKQRCKLGKYDTDKLPRNRKHLAKIERKLILRETLQPTILLIIKVTLILTNINGVRRHVKSSFFGQSEILEIIRKLQRKHGFYYLDRDIWDSICRVERGKVSNKMRFAVYERDGYRCRKCGRRTNDLEVDHIIPISKGGKSTFDNLQTLCHRCNMKKGSKIE